MRPVPCDFVISKATISIHAPQWGATMSPPGPLLVQINFNPRTPVGCDDELSPASVTTLRFQSTHPSGVRHAPLADRVKAIEISIHAPQWGATTRYAHLRVAALFQSTHPSGVRLCCPWSLPRRSAISIHAPQWGATLPFGVSCC